MIKLITVLASALALAGCADYVSFDVAPDMRPVGFWYGAWHGVILPISWLCSVFNEKVAIYAIYNNGGWYDFGFAMGAGSVTQLLSLVLPTPKTKRR